MLHNPYEDKNTAASLADELENEQFVDELQLDNGEQFSTIDDPLDNSSNFAEQETSSKFVLEDFPPIVGEKYTPHLKKGKLAIRDVSVELTPEEYHERLAELNVNAENKHYVLFFGQPASGKTWIIGSVLHYMKNYLEGMVYLDSEKTTASEDELFYQLQNCFNGVIGAGKLTSTDTKQYFELHISFTPKDSTKPPMNIVFIDASGEHSEQGFRTRHKADSGKLPNYLLAILESNVQTKLAFVYDQSLADEKGAIPQMNVLNAVFTHIQHIQRSQKKFFPKALLLSKADRIWDNDFATVERNGRSAENYALEKIPAFANSFFNESPENSTIFYKMGIFSKTSDLILEFDKECPERFFRWLYKKGIGISPVPEPTCWDKFKAWFKGEIK